MQHRSIIKSERRRIYWISGRKYIDFYINFINGIFFSMPYTIFLYLSANLSIYQTIYLSIYIFIRVYTRVLRFIYSNRIFSANVFFYEYLINKMFLLVWNEPTVVYYKEIHLIVRCALRQSNGKENDELSLWRKTDRNYYRITFLFIWET